MGVRILTTTFILLVMKVTCVLEKIWKVYKSTNENNPRKLSFPHFIALPSRLSINLYKCVFFFKKTLLFDYDSWNIYFFRNLENTEE